MATKKQYQVRRIGLSDSDRSRLAKQAMIQGRTQTAIAREAIGWYLDNIESLGQDTRESEVAQAMRYATDCHVAAIKNGVDRLCKMLARQGAAIGTLYELTWMSLPDDDSARAVFEAATRAAKQKMRKHVQKDEEDIAAALKGIVSGS